MEPSPAPFVLASLLTSYPSPDLGENFRILMEDGGVNIPDGLRLQIQRRAGVDEIEDLQSQYIEIFDRGHAANPIHETEYGRHRTTAKGGELSDIAGFYRAFGFDLEPGLEMLDHISVELEFYALMLMKQVRLAELDDQEGVRIVEDGGKKFLKDHLGRFVPAVAARPGVVASDYYREVFRWCADLIESECRRLGIEVERVDWTGEPALDKEGELSCSAEACKT